MVERYRDEKAQGWEPPEDFVPNTKEQDPEDFSGEEMQGSNQGRP